MPKFKRLSGVNHVHRKNRLLPGDGASSNAYVSSLRATLWRKSQGQILQLPRPIPLHGICATDLQRKLVWNVPEPTTLALMGLGQAGIGYSWHRHMKAAYKEEERK